MVEDELPGSDSGDRGNARVDDRKLKPLRRRFTIGLDELPGSKSGDRGGAGMDDGALGIHFRRFLTCSNVVSAWITAGFGSDGSSLVLGGICKPSIRCWSFRSTLICSESNGDLRRETARASLLVSLMSEVGNSTKAVP